MNPNHEGNLWVAFEFWSQYHLAIRRIVPLHCSDFSKSFENRLCSSLCSQDLPLQKNKSYPHCDGSYLQPEPWEHHHLHWHHLQPGMGGDLHDYAVRLRSESLPNTRKSVTGHDLYKSVPSHKFKKVSHSTNFTKVPKFSSRWTCFPIRIEYRLITPFPSPWMPILRKGVGLIAETGWTYSVTIYNSMSEPNSHWLYPVPKSPPACKSKRDHFQATETS